MKTFQKTTFYFLVLMFCRSTLPQSMGRFLNASLASSLRFCPVCLEEKGFYSLLWRFSDLSCCVEHFCKLVELCPECNSTLPFVSNSLSLYHCPNCSCDLRTAYREFVAKEDIGRDVKFDGDLKYLLSGNSDICNSPEEIGLKLRNARKIKGYSIDELSVGTGLSRSVIENLESGSIDRGIGSFKDYVCYVYFLGLSMKDVFQKEWRFTRRKRSIQISKKYKNELIQKVKLEIESLEPNEKLVVEDLAEKLQVNHSSLYRYKEIRSMIQPKEWLNRNKYEKRLEELLEKIEGISISLSEEEEPITYKALSKELGMHENSLRHYKAIRDFVREKNA